MRRCSIRTCSTFISFCFFGVLLLCAPSFAAEDKSEGTPKLDIPQAEYDFGAVGQGAKVVHEFELRNTGNGPLEIQRMVPACGCTASSVSSDVIEPGAVGKVKVEFDTSGFSGDKRKTVRLYTNDSEQPTSILTIRGRIEPEVVIEPKRVFFGEVIKKSEEEALASQEVTVSVRDGSQVQLKGVRSFSKQLLVTEIESSPKRRRFSVEIDGETPIKELRERIVLELSGAKQRTMNIPVSASVKGPLRIKPSTVSFGILESEKAVSRRVKFENLGEDGVSIEEISSSHPAVNVAHKEIKKGRVYVIEVTVDPEKVSKDLRASIEIKTDDEEQELLSLSVYGTLPPKI